MIAIIDNGEDYSDHAMHFIEVPSVEAGQLLVTCFRAGWCSGAELVAVVAELEWAEDGFARPFKEAVAAQMRERLTGEAEQALERLIAMVDGPVLCGEEDTAPNGERVSCHMVHGHVGERHRANYLGPVGKGGPCLCWHSWPVAPVHVCDDV